MKLSDNHKRAVSSTLKVLEERIDHLEQLMSGGRKMYSVIVQNDLPPEINRSILEICGRIKSAIASAFLKYELEPQTVILSHAISTVTTFSWVDLEETETESLLHYGEFSSEEARIELDQDLENITTILKNMISINTK